MLKSIDCVLIWSQHPEKLTKFYKQVLELKVLQELDHPQDTGYLFELESGPQLWIGKHSEVKGKNQDPARHMINFLVDSVDKSYRWLKSKGVKFIAKPFAGPTGNGYFATFIDPEGNILQLWSREK